jgi:hypothetical protein
MATLFKRVKDIPRKLKIKYVSDQNRLKKLSKETGVSMDKINFILATTKEYARPKDPDYIRHLEFSNGGRTKMKRFKGNKRHLYSKTRSRLRRSGHRR